MLFFDFEVFKMDWLIVAIDPINKKEFVIHNNKDELVSLYNDYKNDIWVGFNCRNYDTYILKAILLDFNPKEVNDFIIVEGKKGYQYSKLFNKISLNVYDVYLGFNGLKTLEAFQGHSIYESEVDFNLDRKLNPAELAETIEYCRNDVMETINVFIEQKQEFDAIFGLIKMYNLPLSYIGKTKTQLAATVLGAKKPLVDRKDEFDITLVDTLRIEKYKHVVDWFLDQDNRDYSKSLVTEVSGVEHTFAWGGLHGAVEQYHDTGLFLHVDVNSYYPNLMRVYNFLSRNVVDPEKYNEIINLRLKYKKEKNPLQAPLKIVLNSTYGGSKDKYNQLYDPLMANNVCVNGQLLLLDLLEHLEAIPSYKLIQSNTDGLIIKIDEDDFNLADDICYEWETRTGMGLGFDYIKEIHQKDVNNYLFIDEDGKIESKGAYVKKLSKLDYDMPIINKAIVSYLVNKTPVEDTINECDDLIEFQKIYKVSSKYEFATHNGRRVHGNVFRVFASTAMGDTYLGKCKTEGATNEKFGNCPESCFIDNGDVTNKKVNWKLDKQWYIDLTKKRLEDFGIKME